MNGFNKLWVLVGIVGVAFLFVLVGKPIEKQTSEHIPVLTSPNSSNNIKLSVADALQTIKSDNLKESLEYLASDELEGRMSGKKGHFTSVKWIEDECKKIGLKTERQKFSIRRMNPGPKNEQGEDWTENLFAYIEGNDPVLKDEIVVIGAHLDHIGYGPSMARDNVIGVHNGADDNASGSVVVLEAAKFFAKVGPQPRTIVFQWYSAEEMGLHGSNFYVNNPTFPKNGPNIKKHVAMINLDMVGRLGSGFYSVGWHDGNSSIDLRKIINDLNPKYPFNKSITSHGSGGSDHANFHNKKVGIIFLHTGLHADYHTVKDDADKINYDGLEKIAQYASEAAYIISNLSAAPKFNHKDFKPMQTTHDHGHGLFHDHIH